MCYKPIAGLAALLMFISIMVAVPSTEAVGPGNGTELSCAIIIWGNQDYEWKVTSDNGTYKTYSSHCMDAVKLARKRCGGKSLNFVVTHFWKYTDQTGAPGRFCYKTNKGDDQIPVVCTEFIDWYPENVTLARNLTWRFYKGMKGCFITAIWEGFTNIKITPHLDDGSGQGGWRNVLRLHPNEKLEGYSYNDIMLRPLMRALNESIVQTNTTNTTTVYFTLQGEMNLALAAYPLAWKEVLTEAREKLAGDDPIRQKNVKVGVSMNFNKLCGSYCWGGSAVTTAAVDPSVLAAINMTAYKELMYAIDYLGISNYPAVGKALESGWWPMESSADELNGEMMGLFGFGLKEFIASGKEFHLSEFGIGGGRSQKGNEVANSIQELGDLTFFGMFGTYGHFPDPWQKPEFRAFRKDMYSQAIKWLSTKGGPQYRVDGAYLWSMSSWDVAALYWASTTKLGSYYDEEVMDMIRDWNDNATVPGS